MSESSIEGVEELIIKLQTLERIPQSIVTNAAKKGANIALKAAKANLQPVHGAFLGRKGKEEQHQGGDLQKAMGLEPEKSPPGKKVYRISTTWYARWKELYFTTRDGKRIEGSHFLKRALTEHYDEIKDAIIEEMSKGVDKVVGGS